MILRELNYYRRRNHYFPYIRWHNSLAVTGFECQKKIIRFYSKKRSSAYCKETQLWRARKLLDLEKKTSQQILY